MDLVEIIDGIIGAGHDIFIRDDGRLSDAELLKRLKLKGYCLTEQPRTDRLAHVSRLDEWTAFADDGYTRSTTPATQKTSPRIWPPVLRFFEPLLVMRMTPLSSTTLPAVSGPAHIGSLTRVGTRRGLSLMKVRPSNVRGIFTGTPLAKRHGHRTRIGNRGQGHGGFDEGLRQNELNHTLQQ